MTRRCSELGRLWNEYSSASQAQNPATLAESFVLRGFED